MRKITATVLVYLLVIGVSVGTLNISCINACSQLGSDGDKNRELYSPSNLQVTWFDTDWQYRMPVTVTDQSGTTLADHQVNVTVDTASLISAGKMKNDCSDIRFTDVNDVQLPYWIESGVNTPTTTIWVKVPTIPAYSSTTIYMYYGNPSATAVSDGKNTFETFDDFNDGVIDTQWTVQHFQSDTSALIANVTESGGILEIQCQDDEWGSAVEYGISASMNPCSSFIWKFRSVIPNWGGYGPSAGGYRGTHEFITASAGYTGFVQSERGQLCTQYDGTSSTDLASVHATYPPDSWWTYELVYTGDTSKYYISGALIGTLNSTQTPPTLPFDVIKFSAVQWGTNYPISILKIDYTYLRKYADPEPAVTVGAEEMQASLSITNVVAQPDPQLPGGYVNISATVSNAYGVWVNITDPNSTQYGNYSMSYDAGSARYYYNTTYSFEGIWTFVIWANDTGGNWTSAGGDFEIRLDAAPPVIDLLSPANNSVIRAGTVLDFDVSDPNLDAVNYSTSTYFGWDYKKPVTITELSGTTLTDFQVKITVDTASLISAGKMKNDCSDIRFTDVNDVQLPYWIESGVNTPTTTIWVKVPTIPAYSSTTIYMYYGNPSASPADDGKNTFEIFDDFNDGVIDTQWTLQHFQSDTSALVTTVTESNGILKIQCKDDDWGTAVEYGISASVTPCSSFIWKFRSVIPNWGGYGPSAGGYRGAHELITASAGHTGFVQSERGQLCTQCDGTSYTDLASVHATYPPDSWWTYELVYTGDTSKYYLSGTLIGTLDNTQTPPTPPFNGIKFSAVQWSSSYPISIVEIDYTYLRKYAEPEPTVTVGAEQQIVVSWLPFNSPYDIDTTNWTDGSYRITIHANDTFSNENTEWFVFTIDSTLPAITLISPTNNSVVYTGATIDLAVADANLNLVNYSVNGVWSAFNPPYDITTAGWTEGIYTITVYATDLAGNNNTKWFIFTVGSPPVITLVSPANNSVIQPGTIIDLHVADPNLNVVNYAVNGIWSTFTSPYDIDTTGWADGSYTITIYANDTYSIEDTKWFAFAVDSTIPSITLNSPTNNSVIQAGSVIDFTVTDAHLMIAEYSVNGGAYQVLSPPYDISTTGWSDDSYTITIRVEDSAGNENTKWYLFTIDSTPPSVILISPAPDQFIEAVFTFKIAVTDQNTISYVNITVFGTTVKASYNTSSGYYECVKDTRLVSDGNYSVCADVVDIAGNTNFTSTINFHVDNTVPTLILNSPRDGDYISQIVKIDAAATDMFLSAVQYRIDNAPWIDINVSLDTTNIPDGNHTITVRALDMIGHESSVVIQVTVDNNKPVCAIVSPTQYQVVNGKFTFEVNADDTVGIRNVDITVFGSTSTMVYNAQTGYYEHTVDTETLQDGNYSVYATAYDLSGKTNTTAALFFDVDNTKPTIVLVSPLNNSIIKKGTVIDIEVTDLHIENVEYSVDGGLYQTLHSPYDIQTDLWDEGTHNIDIRARDLAGNENTEIFTFVLDSTAPVISLDSPLNNSVVKPGTVLNFEITDTHLLGAEYSINEQASKPLTSPYDIRTEGWTDGFYNVTIFASDIAGNMNDASFTFIIDSIKPVITLNSPRNNSVFKPGTKIDFAFTDVHLTKVEYSVNKGTYKLLSSPYSIDTGGWQDGFYEIAVRACDSAGNEKIEIFVFTIDGTPPTIISFSPADASVNIPVNITVKIVFSEKINQPSFANGLTVSPSVNYTIKWLNNTAVQLLFPDSLQYATEYTVSLQDVKDIAGNEMTASFSFTTLTKPVAEEEIEGHQLWLAGILGGVAGGVVCMIIIALVILKKRKKKIPPPPPPPPPPPKSHSVQVDTQPEETQPPSIEVEYKDEHTLPPPPLPPPPPPKSSFPSSPQPLMMVLEYLPPLPLPQIVEEQTSLTTSEQQEENQMIEHEIKELAKLKEKGLISEEEYRASKSRFLKQYGIEIDDEN